MSLKEIKSLRSSGGFYPDHYFKHVLYDDIKSSTVDGSQLRKLRSSFQETLNQMSECEIDSEAYEFQEEAMKDAFDDLLIEIIDRFGYSNVSAEPNQVNLNIKGRYFLLPIERDIQLMGHGKLWILRHDLPSTGDDEIMGLSKKLFRDGREDDESLLKWEDILKTIFDDAEGCFAVDWVLINAGTRLYLVESGRFQESSDAYLELDLKKLYEFDSKEEYQLAEALFSTHAFPINNTEFVHEDLSASAHKKAAEITKSLRDTVRESIEILANELLASHRINPLKALSDFDLESDEGRKRAAQALHRECIRYLYRILFMLFSEGQSTSKRVLPVDLPVYQMGYAMEKLRELEALPLVGRGDKNFIQQSLEKTFALYFKGFRPVVKSDIVSLEEDDNKTSLGFYFPSVGTQLFDPESTPLLRAAHLRDSEMQKVVQKLSLAKTGTKKKTTHRVHYANLGLNHLGAVYEGLLSLQPMILEKDALVLEKESKEAAHRIVFVDQATAISDKKFKKDENDNIKMISAGQFTLCPVGLERKFSASFYTPEVLTRFLVKEAVEALLEKQEETWQSISDIEKRDQKKIEFFENLKILEPAVGSGAFLNAAIDELARKMAPLYRHEGRKQWQEKTDQERIKAAKEDRSFKEPKEPSFELESFIQKAKAHLMSHCVYGVDLNGTAVELAQVSLWLNCIDKDQDLPFLDFRLRQGNSLVGAWLKKQHSENESIPHFLVPDASALDPYFKAHVLGNEKQPFLSDEQKNKLKQKQKSYKDALKDNKTLSRLEKISGEIQKLYDNHCEKREFFRNLVREEKNPAQKEVLGREYKSKSNEYHQLRAIMDLWCSIWFWPVSALEKLPDFSEFLAEIEWVLANELPYGQAQLELLEKSKRSALLVSREIAMKERFFHWDLEFPEVLHPKAGTGFDLVLGNPPWAQVRWEEADFFEERVPGIHEQKLDSKGKHGLYAKFLSEKPDSVNEYMNDFARTAGLVNFLHESKTYPFSDSSKTNTYKYFYQRFYELTKKDGIHAMIAQDGILTDDGCKQMKPAFLQELERAYRFVNELKLFEDIGNLVMFLVWVCRKGSTDVDFLLTDNLYHPDTMQRCRDESEYAPYRGMKDENGKFELRGHPHRITRIDENVLEGLAKFSDGSLENVTIPIIHGELEKRILLRLAEHDKKLDHTNWFYSQMFNEANSPKKGLITRKPGKAKDIAYAVMTGPNVFVGNPANKAPNPGCKNHRDFSKIDLKSADKDFYPDTVYQLTEKGLQSREYNLETPWGAKHVEQYRILFRGLQVSTTGKRTLSSCIIPPKMSHIFSLSSISMRQNQILIETSALFHSIIFDFLLRTISGGSFTKSVFQKIPSLTKQQKENPLLPALVVRGLRLSSISTYYADLWKEVFQKDFCNFSVGSQFEPKLAYSKLKNLWEFDTCIREEKQREQALCEIDVITALLFGFTEEDLIKLYRSQFGVLQKNLEDLPTIKEHSEAHFPREKQMREAYQYFASELQKRGFSIPTDERVVVKTQKRKLA